LGRLLEERGGRILKCAAAEKILVEDGKAVGVRVATVSRRESRRFEFRAPVVVSNADAMHTYRNLLGEEHCGRWMLEHLGGLKPTYPCYLLHLGLRGMAAEKLHEAEGYYWSSYEPEDVIRTVFKVFIPTRFDPALAPPGCQILIVQKLTPVRFEEMTDWAGHKAQVETAVMGRLRELLPGIDEHIVVKMSATAWTSFYYTNNWQGAMLGWEMSPEQLGSARLPISGPVENLYLTGHWTQPGGGITPVIISAQKVSQTILRGKEGDADAMSDYEAFRSLVSSGKASGGPGGK
jgi:prolycopene isomerase